MKKNKNYRNRLWLNEDGDFVDIKDVWQILRILQEMIFNVDFAVFWIRLLLAFVFVISIVNTILIACLLASQ